MVSVLQTGRQCLKKSGKRMNLKFLANMLAVFGMMVIPTIIGCGHAFANDESNARNLIQTFIEGEFQGKLDMRQNYAVFVKERKNGLGVQPQFDYSLDQIISLDANPLLVVEKFVLDEVVLDSDKATVVVLFSVIAETKGEGVPERKFYLTKLTNQQVKYELRKIKGNWYVLNPPLPRVSRVALLSFYEGRAHGMQQLIQSQRASQPQKIYYEYLLEGLKVISVAKQLNEPKQTEVDHQ